MTGRAVCCSVDAAAAVAFGRGYCSVWIGRKKRVVCSGWVSV